MRIGSGQEREGQEHDVEAARAGQPQPSPSGKRPGTARTESPAIRPAVTLMLMIGGTNGLVLNSVGAVLVVPSFHVNCSVPAALRIGKQPLAVAEAVQVADVTPGWLPLGEMHPNSLPSLTDRPVEGPLSGGEKTAVAVPAQLRSIVALAVALPMVSAPTQQAASTAESSLPRRCQRPACTASISIPRSSRTRTARRDSSCRAVKSARPPIARSPSERCIGCGMFSEHPPSDDRARSQATTAQKAYSTRYATSRCSCPRASRLSTRRTRCTGCRPA